MSTNDQSVLHANQGIVQEENVTMEYIRDIFDEEGPFGEADCAGL
jgi:hypothetical protein